MTKAQTRKTAQAPPAPQEDPLADLRDPDEGERYPAPGDTEGGDTEATGDADLTTQPGLVTQESQDEARAVVIAAWHADTVSLGFLHKGGSCGCRYLAQIALNAVLPIQANGPEGDEE